MGFYIMMHGHIFVKPTFVEPYFVLGFVKAHSTCSLYHNGPSKCSIFHNGPSTCSVFIMGLLY